MRKIKLLVVDDSMLFREVLSRYIREDTEIDVVGTAGDAYSARDMILKFEPDVMTLDIEMPKMDGVAFLKKLLPQYYLPVIVVSSSIEQKQSALDAGAVGFIQKPSARTTAEMQGFAQNIARAVKSAFAKNGGTKPETTVTHTPLSSTGKKFHKADTVLAFGASTGGTEALEKVIRELPADSPATLVVQHMPAGFTKMYSERLNRSCKMEVKEAEDGDRLRRESVRTLPVGGRTVHQRCGNRRQQRHRSYTHRNGSRRRRRNAQNAQRRRIHHRSGQGDLRRLRNADGGIQAGRSAGTGAAL